MRIVIHKLNASVVDDLDASVKSTTFKFDPLYSGGPAFIDGFDQPAYVDLATLKVDPAPKALLEHDMDAVVGRLENIVNDGKQISCDAVIGGNSLSAKVVEWAKNVASWVCSIGVYRIEEKNIEFIKKNATAEVNGRKIVGPAYIVHYGSLAEGSFVAIGGDGDAKVLSKGGKMKLFGLKASDDEKEVEKDEALEEADVAEPISEEELETIVEDAVEQAVEDAGEAIPPEVVEDVAEEIVDELVGEETDPVEASLRATKLAERKLRAKKTDALSESRRVEGIKTLCSAYAQGAKVAATAIAKGWSIERTERILESQKRNDAFRSNLASPGNGLANGTPNRRDVIAAAFAQTLGMTPERAQRAFHVDQRVIDASLEKPYRGMSFRSVVAASLNSYKPGAYDVYTGAASGWSDCKAECLREKLVGGAFRAGFSTISATDVFQLVLQAFLEPSEETAPRVYQKITRENKLVDFNSVSSYLPTIQGRLQKISETGAIQNVSFTTKEFERSADPYAAIFTIPEKTIINDQIDTFAELLRQLENLGDDCLEHDVAETFWRLVDGDIKDASGNALVSATAGNYIASGSLDEDGLGAAIAAINSFSTANGVPLASDNLLLLAGTKLSPTALKLANAGYVDFQNGTAYPNVFQGRFTPIEWAYLDAAHARAKKDDGSTASLLAGEKTWILLRDPARRPAVCVNKVVGFESPKVEQFNADPSVWGTTYRYIYPYGVSVQYNDAIVAVTNS